MCFAVSYSKIHSRTRLLFSVKVAPLFQMYSRQYPTQYGWLSGGASNPNPNPNPDPDPMHTRIFAGKGDVHNIPWAKCALAELKSTPRRRFRTKTRSGRRSTGKVIWPPQKTVTDKNRRKAPDFGFRLHDAPHMGDMDENNPKHWISQLLVVPDVFHFDSHVDLAYSNHTLCVGGLS